jgi:hypothetical protein
MVEIAAFMQKFCTVGARALQRYAEISGEEPSTAPEYFMPAFILSEFGKDVDETGNQLTITLETTFSTLWEWNSNARTRDPGSIPSDLVRLGEKLGTQRVDMVLFTGQVGIPKDQHDFLALVEFNKGNLEAEQEDKTDRDKLRGVLRYIDTCRHGIVCGSVEKKWYSDQQTRAHHAGDGWFEAETKDGAYVFCARVFEKQA